MSRPQAGLSWLARMGEPPLPPRYKIPYDIPLRPDGRGSDWARLVLPHDLTRSEAERICGVVRAIAI